MRKIIVTAAIVAAAALLAAGCGKKTVEGPSADELRNEIAGVTRDVNAYLSEHNFANTGAGGLAEELNKWASQYGELERRAQDMRTEGGGEEYGDVGNLAGEGRAKVEALSLVLGAGPPLGDPEKAAEFHDVVTNWADYSERVGEVPDEAAPVEGGEPGVGKPAPPGEGEPGAPSYPGKGYHYGWWKNPEWARDPASREGDVGAPGAGEMDREREREREHKGAGPGEGGPGPGGAGGGKGKGGK
jgi:outer membrane murein-binding lipoprotein Lpp